jgi:hypothetical protein
MPKEAIHKYLRKSINLTVNIDVGFTPGKSKLREKA